MKKVKKQTGIKAFLKRNRVGVIIWGSIAAFLLTPVFLLWYFNWQNERNNSAKELASIMIPFAQENHLKKIGEYNGAGSLDNSVPYFDYTYEGNQSIDQTSQLIKAYLTKQGYYIYENISSECTTTGCSIYGTNAVRDEVSVLVTKDDGHGLLNGEKTSTAISFISHECSDCIETKPARDLAQIMPAFAQSYALEKLQESGNTYCSETSTPCYNYLYLDSQSINDSSRELKSYLVQKGYSIQETSYTNDSNCFGYWNNQQQDSCNISQIKAPINDGQPILILEGENATKDKVYAVISNRTFSISDKQGEFKVPLNNIVITLTFTAHK